MKSSTALFTIGLLTLALFSAPAVMAQTLPSQDPPTTVVVRHGIGSQVWRSRFRRPLNPARLAVFADLRAMTRLAMLSGNRKELLDTYQHILAVSHDPLLRSYAYLHLARLQLKVSNTDAAFATLQKSLDENLTRLNNQPQRAPAAGQGQTGADSPAPR